MKLRRIFAALAAAAVAATMAISASAATVDYTETINLKGGDNATNEEKMWQYEMKNLEGNGILTQVILDVTAPFSEAGWVGGGGAFGMNFGDEWFQADFAPEKDSPDSWTVTIDIPETLKDVPQDFTGTGIVQIGWWWGAGDTLTVNKVQFVFKDAPADDSPAGDSPAGDSPAGDSPAGDSPAGDSPAGDSPATGATAGLALAGLALAGAAIVATKKSK